MSSTESKNMREGKAFARHSDRPSPARLPPKKWETVRADYVGGLGSLRELARQHGLKLSTVEARCRREHWTVLRREREENALKGLVGSPVTLPTVEPVEDAEWWTKQDRQHLVASLSVLAKLRTATEEKIAGASASELERLAGAVAAIAQTERELLELNSRSPRHYALSLRPGLQCSPVRNEPIDLPD